MALKQPKILNASYLSTALRPFSLPISPPLSHKSFHTGPVTQHATPTKPLRSGAAFPGLSTQDVNLAPRFSHKTSPIAKSTLSCLPLTSLLRNLLITELSRRPLLLNPSLKILSAIAYSKSPLLNPTHNPPLRWLLKRTLYPQFCAGETPSEVAATVSRLKRWGICGVLLGWAREVECRDEGTNTTCSQTPSVSTAISEQSSTDATSAAEISAWLTGLRSTLGLLSAGDVICVKFTGAGSDTLRCLRNANSPPPLFAAGLHELCTTAASKNVTFQIDAEQVAMQPGIEKWSLDLQRRFNKHKAVVVSTYQAYLKATPPRLKRDLRTAADEGFVLGVKLVRGAYLGSDPRLDIWGSKEETDAAYDGLAEGLILREWRGVFEPTESETATLPSSKQERAMHEALEVDAQQSTRSTSPSFPRVSLIVATHNRTSTRKALAAQEATKKLGNPQTATQVRYAQLMGMADHVSCELVNKRREVFAAENPQKQSLNTEDLSANSLEAQKTLSCAPQPYKYLVWGTLTECLQYLVRRAEENRDAVTRTEEGRAELWAEASRRLRSVVGL